MIKFLDILGRYEAAAFSHLEAAELLGMSERTFVYGVSKAGENVVAGQFRVVSEDFVNRHAGIEPFQHVLNGDP